ncbi:DUF3999 family protein [uncultured Dokdonia sp.]|uniref:DUF3999 family protein n=1 Tax=uncultured Dokdonia sp. TaxID=575653 RepID=UPI00261E359B|nr:DUF3999 family protein [uncultured Dokdonia sp.]
MKLQTNLSIGIGLLASFYSYGQMQDYTYARELKGISDSWHKVVIPETMFGTLSRKLTDIRLYGITKENDTIEAPYILQKTKDQVTTKEITFNTLNTSRNNEGYFYTFEIPSTAPINQIDLDFGQQNFDWKVRLEGSQDQQEWFTITDDYRIVSIKNTSTNFQFSTLTFPDAKYRYFKLRINAESEPELKKVSISQQHIIEGNFNDYKIKSIQTEENKQARQTEISIDLQYAVPVSHLKMNPKASYDYYRPVTIKYLTDSIKTEKGWIYNYRTLTSGVLNSLGKNEFKARSRVIKKLKIVIHNQDNQPLEYDDIQIKGYAHELIARFTEPATYFLTYGNAEARLPTYDIQKFKENIPTTLTTLELGDETMIQKTKAKTTSPLFENKIWLWAIMGLLIIILGGFSLKMIKQK